MSMNRQAPNPFTVIPGGNQDAKDAQKRGRQLKMTPAARFGRNAVITVFTAAALWYGGKAGYAAFDRAVTTGINTAFSKIEFVEPPHDVKNNVLTAQDKQRLDALAADPARMKRGLPSRMSGLIDEAVEYGVLTGKNPNHDVLLMIDRYINTKLTNEENMVLPINIEQELSMLVFSAKRANGENVGPLPVMGP